MKNFPVLLRDEFYRENFFAVDVVFIRLPDTTGAVTPSSVLRFCNGGIDVILPSIDGTYQTFTAQGDFISFTNVTEEFDVKLGKFSIYLSGLTSGLVDKFTGGANGTGVDFEGVQVQVAKVFLNYNTLQPISNPYIMFDGVIYNVTVVESDVTCTINIECSTLWADFDRTAGRMTNNSSNWLFQLGNKADTCMSKSGTVGQQEYKWGRA